MAKTERWGNIDCNVNTCALTGAAAFFGGIPKAEIIANGPLWCYFYALRYLEKADPKIERRFQGTQPDNTAVVYGTEDCLLETLTKLKENSKPSVLLIENSCSVSLIGDDIAGIARKAALPFPTVCFDSGGLIGGFSEGYKLAAKIFFKEINLHMRDKVEPKSVNLLGCSLSYFNGENDLQELKNVLILAGYKVLACPGAGSTIEEIRAMSKAELNIVLHEELGLDLARQLEKDYNMPYLSPGVPYGIEGTIKWLNRINEALTTDLSLLISFADKTRYMLNSRINDIKSTWGDLWVENAVVSASSSTAISLAETLRSEWVDVDKLTVILQDDNVKEKNSEYIDGYLLASEGSTKIEEALDELKNGLLLASSSETAYIQRKQIASVLHCNISYPVHDELLLTQEPFMGIRGSAHILQRLWNQKMSMAIKKSGF